ncbi:MAG: response regulator [Syntrophales bacterium]|jgi:signal transduction histidine kinase|nr:response regulator [Syntrophales bacterium]MCK9392237.1 response regulator [Syntrophales bacterium]
MDKIKIMIVEDSLTQAMQLQHILEEKGYDVTVASNGSEALRSIKKSKPLIVISDIIMPEMDGYELCRQIKANESYRDISVILLTSLSQPQAVIWALQSGADKFLTKPYDESHLISTLQNLKENLKSKDPPQKAINISYRGENYFIDSTRSQIVNLLLSTYETAVNKNLELIEAQDELKRLNQGLEEIVDQRTAVLRIEVNERKAAEAALQARSDEVKTMSQQLLQAEKLATMGELASSIAHELNNPLATVSLRAESLISQTSGDDPRRRELEIIGQEVERMGNLVTNLLQFSRRSQQQISTVSVCDEIEKTLELVQYHLRNHGIAVAREFKPEVPLIHADRQQLRQLFLNLFTNASDAMPEGGTLTIRVTKRPEEKQICVEIADTGVGIPPEILPKVLEAFYTTKPEGKGTGLGLAICRRIAQAHNGTLNITSEGGAGNGTRVYIALPFSNGSNSAWLEDE